MATLEKIRRRSGLLIVVIGIALAGFILTDLFANGNTIFSSDPNVVGSVNGSEISVTEYGERIEALRAADQAYSTQPQSALVNMVWNNWLREEIYAQQLEALGFAVTSDELFDNIIENPNISGNQQFLDQNGQFSPNLFRSALANLRDMRDQQPEAWQGWLKFEDEVRKQALIFKYNDAVEAGIYTPKALARHKYAYDNITHDVGFVQLPYTSVSDDEVEVTEEDFRSYYEDFKYKYKQDEESRNIVFVNFPIEPSEQDRAEVREELTRLIEPTVRYNSQTDMNDTLPGFRTTDNDSVFVTINSGLPYRPGFWRSGELSSNVDSIMFNAEPGFIYGPYEESGGYKLTKLQEIAYLPDSVKARHILITYRNERNPNVDRDPQQAQALADSLFDYLKENRGAFVEVSDEFSSDQVAKEKGGDLGWFNHKAMVPAFGNYCFNNDEGDLGMVQTQFGFHIVEILEQEGSTKAVKVATIYQEVVVSRRTEKEIYDAASQFAAQASNGSFDSAAASMGYQARPMTELSASADNITGLGMARPVVTWAYGKEKEVAVGDIGLISNEGRAYIVVQLTAVNPEGYKPLDNVREQIRPMVINRVKAEQILIPNAEGFMEGQTNINAIAEKAGNQMNLQKIRMGVGAITGIGQEPEIVGMMAGTAVGELRGPEAGNRGVYIWQTNAVSEFNDKGDYTSDAEGETTRVRGRASAQLFNALVKKYEVVDNRIRFY